MRQRDGSVGAGKQPYKKYQPKYNILLRDDKTYPYICVTADKWPRIIKTRRILKDGAKYFGPYSDVGAVNSMVDLLNSVYRIKNALLPNFRKGLDHVLTIT